MDSQEPITYLNSKDKCIICFGKPEKWDNHQDIDLIKHHVSYFPQVIAFVHYQCHAKIHDPNKPLIYVSNQTRTPVIQRKIKKDLTLYFMNSSRKSLIVGL